MKKIKNDLKKKKLKESWMTVKKGKQKKVNKSWKNT